MSEFYEFRIISPTPVEARVGTGVLWARYLPQQIYRRTAENEDFMNQMIEAGQAEPCDPNAADAPMNFRAEQAQVRGAISTGK